MYEHECYWCGIKWHDNIPPDPNMDDCGACEMQTD